MNQKGNTVLFVIIIVLLLTIVSTGAFYLDSKNNSTKINSSSNISAHDALGIPSKLSPTPDPTSNWQTQSFQIIKDVGLPNHETINISLKMPSDWIIQTIRRSVLKNSDILNCSDYVLTSSDKITTLTLSPICEYWKGETRPWVTNGVVIKEVQNPGQEGQTQSIVRSPGLHLNTYIYTLASKSRNEDDGALILYYDELGPGTIPFNVSLNATNIEPDIASADQIVTSLETK